MLLLGFFVIAKVFLLLQRLDVLSQRLLIPKSVIIRDMAIVSRFFFHLFFCLKKNVTGVLLNIIIICNTQIFYFMVYIL